MTALQIHTREMSVLWPRTCPFSLFWRGCSWNRTLSCKFVILQKRLFNYSRIPSLQDMFGRHRGFFGQNHSLLHLFFLVMLLYVVCFISSNKTVDWNFQALHLAASRCCTSLPPTVFLQTPGVLLVPYELQDCSTAVLWSLCIFGFFRSLLCVSFGLTEL